MQRQRLPYRFYFTILFTLFSFSSLADEQSPQELLADNYQTLLLRALETLEPPHSPKADLLEQLMNDLADATSAEGRLSLMATIFQHRRSLVAYLNDDRFQSLITFLLSDGLESLAEHFLQLAEQEASDYNLATLRLAFAHHYARRSRWDQAIQQLSAISINNILTPSEADHAYIIYGLAMQGKKMHREALDYYNRVPADSPHYQLAQLNMALAYLRQDWWTDAQIAIERALSSPSAQFDDNSDRLYTVLGFSQIQYGFYRRARESFRKVHVDSIYANRALLGLGLAALHQNDVVAAINAFDHLKAGDKNDLTVSESYLLSAFALSQLSKTTSASASYAEATAFYQHYLARLEHQLKRLGEANKSNSFAEHKLTDIAHMITPDDAELLSRWQQRMQVLEALASLVEDSDSARLQRQISEFITQYASLALMERQRVIESYSNQAHFGLATLYDSN